MTIDLDQIRLRDVEYPIPKPKLKKPRKEIESGPFIKGPIPVTWLVQAGELPGKYTLRTALVIFYVHGLTGGGKLLMERFHFDQFKIGKDSTRRALQRLEQAGLIKLGKKGRKFEVRIILKGKTDGK